MRPSTCGDGQKFNPKRSLGRLLYFIFTACSLLFFIRFCLFLIRNSSLLLIKSQTKSTLLKEQNPGKP